MLNQEIERVLAEWIRNRNASLINSPGSSNGGGVTYATMACSHGHVAVVEGGKASERLEEALALSRFGAHGTKQLHIRVHLLDEDKVGLESLFLRVESFFAIHPHLEVFVRTDVFQRRVPTT